MKREHHRQDRHPRGLKPNQTERYVVVETEGGRPRVEPLTGYEVALDSLHGPFASREAAQIHADTRSFLKNTGNDPLG